MQRWTNQKRMMAALLLTCFLAAAGLSMLFAVTHARHHCEGDGCPVCARIGACLQIVKQLTASSSGVARPVDGSVLLRPAVSAALGILTYLPAISLLMLKIRLNN